MMKINKIKLGYIFFLIVLSYSCSNKTTSYFDFRDINEYYVEVDKSSKIDENYLKSYFIDDVLKMSGHGDRYMKTGVWKYYQNNTVILEGKFRNGQPRGTWLSNYFTSLSWKQDNDSVYGYILNIPNSWEEQKLKPFHRMFSFDKENISDANFNVIIGKYDKSLLDILESENAEIKNNPYTNHFRYKENDVLEIIDKYYQREFKIMKGGKKYYLFQSIYGVEDSGLLFTFTFQCEIDNLPKYEGIIEVIFSSIKFYDS